MNNVLANSVHFCFFFQFAREKILLTEQNRDFNCLQEWICMARAYVSKYSFQHFIILFA